MNRKIERVPRADGERSRLAILNAAARLATVEGLEGMSIARLADHIGMSKSGLYAHFGSKEELQLATVERAAEIFNSVVVEPTVEVGDPVVRLQALCDTFLSHIERRVFPGGCFFASAAAEFDTHPGPVKERITELNRGWLTTFEELVRQAQAAGNLQEDDPAQLAFELDAFLLMGNMAFVMNSERLSLDRARDAFQARLNRARAPQASAPVTTA